MDLTIVQLGHDKKIIDLEMGTHFDFMDELSHYSSNQVSDEARKNRLLLRNAMQEEFKPYDTEWWHFTLQNEPFPNTYFHFFVA